jgi:hypothetical protein
MTTYLLLKFAHLIAFVYWLGGDLGTFLASRQVVNPALSAESRATALKIMLACDMGPKLAMPLILPLGLQLAATGGALPLSDTVLSVAWLAGLYWFAVVLVLFLNEGKAFTRGLARLDFYFRVLVIALLGAGGGWALANDYGADWALAKILIFAAMVACGLAIRLNLKAFGPAFAQMMTRGASTETDATMAGAIRRCRPWVWGIWGGLFANAALGIHLL